jgi:hypothetical protein
MPQRLGRIPGASELPGEALCRHRQLLPSFHAAVTVGAEGGIMPRGTKMGALVACGSKTFASAPKTGASRPLCWPLVESWSLATRGMLLRSPV